MTPKGLLTSALVGVLVGAAALGAQGRIMHPVSNPAPGAKTPGATSPAVRHAAPNASDARAAAVRAAAARRAAEAGPTTVTIEREAYSYASGGRRDPFKSLLTTTDLRPMLAELKLVAVAYDPNGNGSVAILRDVNTKAQHRVRAGTLLGRMRVAAIQKKAVVFTIEELGYSRQEILGLNDSTGVRGR